MARGKSVDEPLGIACGTTSITPTKPIPLFGYSRRTGLCDKISDPLEANIIVMNQGNRRAILVSVDLLYVGPRAIAGILRGLGGSISPDQLFVAASHNHFAPSVDETKPALGHCETEYVDFVVQRICVLLKSLLDKEPVEVTANYMDGAAEGIAVNRRRLGRKVSIPPRRGMLILPNPSAFTDNRIRLMEFSSASGKPLAVLWNFACHPTASPSRNCISSEFPGVTRAMLRKQHGQDLPVVFLQGFAGDVRPNLATRRSGPSPLKEKVKWWASRMLNGATFGVPTEDEWKSWANSIAAQALRIEAESQRQPVNGNLDVGLKTIPLRSIGLQGDIPSLTIHRIDLGAISIVGVSAEPVSEYSRLVSAALEPKKVIPVGCVGHVFGYLPTSAMVREGGYEVEEFLSSFGLKGEFSPDVQAVVLGALSGQEPLSDSPQSR